MSQYLLPTLLLSSLNDNFSTFPPVFFFNKKVDFSETAENIRVPHLSTTRVIGTVNTHLKENQFLSVKKNPNLGVNSCKKPTFKIMFKTLIIFLLSSSILRKVSVDMERKGRMDHE